MTDETPSPDRPADGPPVSPFDEQDDHHPPALLTFTGWFGPDPAYAVAWLAILLLAFIWRILGITGTEVWRDEAITVIHTHASWIDLLIRLPFVEDSPPLGFLPFKAWAAISREEWFLRLLPVLFGVWWVDVMMRTARLMHPSLWWPAGLLAAFAHMPVHYSQEIRVYSMLLLAAGLCFWAVERAVCSANPRRWMIALAALLVLAAHCHAVGLFLTPAVGVYLLVRFGRSRWRDAWNPYALGILIVGLLPMVWFARHWTAVRQDRGDWWLEPLTWTQARWMFRDFTGIAALRAWVLTDQAAWKTWVGFAGERIILLGSALLIARGLVGRLRGRVLALLLAGGIVLALQVVTSLVSLPNMIVRTVLPVWTVATLSLAIGAAAVRSKWGRIAGQSIVVAIATIWALSWCWNAYHVPRRPDTQALFNWMADELAPGDLVYVSPRWFKDKVVYELQDILHADRLLDEYAEYEGQPMRHRMRSGRRDHWRERFAAQIRASRRRFGPDIAVWIVSYAGLRMYPDTPEAYLASLGSLEAGRDVFADKPVVIVRYRLHSPPTPSVLPTTSTAPAAAAEPDVPDEALPDLLPK